ncbi:TonB-dependent receptor domain-containing protein [Chitinophaga rhizophila]|uniref:TonB-dependent receptor n=1 Tax=Chitinophaga rhizophila TaxID=2866212 RepID=A0ABS7G6N8_9BACT|nr:TonB-dependent receptor [Chitinophaga rhizophila]MBW8683314.1 TonB-dependent receptor [Chitinophaga rhizophila]
MVKRNILFCLTIFLILLNDCYAQENTQAHIKGTVKDGRTKENVPGASVLLESISDSLNKKTALSNNNGAFSFDNVTNGSYNLTISYLGFKKHRVEQILVDKQNREIVLGDILLEQSNAASLNEVVVSSRRAFVEQKIDRVVVSVDALIANTGTTAFEALNNSPGVTVDDGGNVNLRGKEGVRVFIDDKPTFLTGRELVSYLKSLPSGVVDKIEIMSNPPARYNADGAGGIINIRTKRSKTKGFNGNVNASYSQGVYPQTNNSFNFNYRNDKWSLFGNAGYSLLYNFVNSDRTRRYDYKDTSQNYTLQQHYVEKSRRQGVNYKLGADYKISDNSSIGVMFAGNNMSPYRENGNYDIAFLKPRGSVDSSIYILSKLKERSRNLTANVNFRHQFGKAGNVLTVDLDHLNYKYEQDQLSASTTYLPDQTISAYYNLTSDNPFRARIYSGKADYAQEIFGGIKFEAGAQAILSERNSEGIYFNSVGDVLQPASHLNNKFGYKENINSLYVNFNKDYKRFSLVAGLRLENTISEGHIFETATMPDSLFKIDYTNLFPNAYLSYKLDTAGVNVLTLSAGRRISRPGYQDLNPSVFFFDKYTSYTGNPLLRPEYANNFELSYSNAGDYTVTLAYSRVGGTITQIYEQVDSALIAKPVNIDLVTNFGINTNLSFDLTKWWSANLYLELVRATFKGRVGADEYIDNSRTTFRVNGSTQVKLGGGWSAELSGLYKNKMVIGQAVLAPAWRMNAAVQKKIFKNKATLTLTGQDIFRSWIVNRDIFIPEGVVSLSNRFDTHRITLGVNYRFGKSGNARERKSGIQDEQNRVE